MAINKATLLGRLTRDPQSVTFEGGKTRCNFTIAVDRPRTKDGEDKADFISIVTWDKLAENCAKYLAKGNQVAVCGSIQTGSYEKDGIKRQTFDIRADQVEFLTKPSADSSAPSTEPSKDASIDTLKPIEVADDEFPF